MLFDLDKKVKGNCLVLMGFVFRYHTMIPTKMKEKKEDMRAIQNNIKPKKNIFVPWMIKDLLDICATIK